MWQGVLLRLIFTMFVWICFSGCSMSQQADGYGLLCKSAVPLEQLDDLDKLVARSKESRLVLLGESTHGTKEFYQWRAEITKRLLSESDFSFIAVEGDWMPLYMLNLYVKGLLPDDTAISAVSILRGFNRWPEWMWSNTVISELAEWLKEFNSIRPVEKRVGFYGMDVYGQWDAMDEVLRVAGEHFPDSLEQITKLYSCFSEFGRDEWKYAKAVMDGLASCDDNLIRVVDIFKGVMDTTSCKETRKSLLHGKQSAIVVKNSEDFYRLAYRGSNTESWNSRAMHMHTTVTRLMEIHGDNAKGIVWAHNTHIGDARATNMVNEGRCNIGQLSRQKYGQENITSVGFTTYTGLVNAGSRWGAPMSVMRIPDAREGSIEDILKNCGLNSFYLVFDKTTMSMPELQQRVGHRAIGVVYNPNTERLYNYVPTVLPQRYDVVVFIHTTNSLTIVR